MALQKTYTTSQGITGNYWRIDKISLDRGEWHACNVTLCLYVDAATAATAGSLPIHQETYFWNDPISNDTYTGVFDPATLNGAGKNVKQQAYDQIKTKTDPIDFTTGTTDV